MTLIDDYLKYQKKYSKIYGNKAIVFMQVGSFHEAYATEKKGYDLKKLEPILNLKFTRRDGKEARKEEKEIPATRKNPYMIGFPSISIVKYLTILTQNGYTTIIFDQVESGDEFDRKLTGIYSPGTFISERQTINSNYLLSVYIAEEKQRNFATLLAFGATLIDVSTGECIVHEFYSSSNDEKFGLDELTRLIQAFQPTETVIYFHPVDFDEKNISNIKKYLELDNLLHYFYTYYNGEGNDPINLLSNQSFKINCQNEYLGEIYGINHQATLNKKQSPLEKLDLEKMPYATISLMIMLRYITEHNESLLKNLSYPNIYLYQKHLVLGNDAIKQLNVICSNNLESYNKKFESLFDVINQTTTPMGNRFLKRNLVNPFSQEAKKQIVARYDLIEQLLENKLFEKVKAELKNIYDMERFHRKMGMGIIVPYEFYRLDQFYRATNTIIGLVKNNSKLLELLPEKIIKEFAEYQIAYQKEFEFSSLKKYNKFNDIDESIFKTGIHPKIDEIQTKIDFVRNIIDAIIINLSSLIETTTKKNNNKTELLKSEYNDRDGYYFSITKLRTSALKDKLKKVKRINIRLSNGENFPIEKDDIVFKSLAKGNTKIFITPLMEHTNNLSSEIQNLIKLVKRKFTLSMMTYATTYANVLNKITNFVAEMDFLVSGAIVADKYYYKKPVIPSEENIPSYLCAKKLRHPIVERISTETEYIPNDIELGNVPSESKNGVLLFGLNSCGKTTLAKSVAIAIIMAQIGYYVPAEEFIYEPYMAIYARITGNDNILKGLSSFALEMTELDAILKRTETNGKNTLVIGDEVCRGTEDISGRAIVASTLIDLSQKETSYIFSSHLHDLVNIDEIKKLSNLRIYHLRVDYDENNDCLIFDRRLTPGSGPSVYGLSVAKFLIRNKAFIKSAENIKKKIMNEIRPEISNKQSKYNSKLPVKSCAICHYRPSEFYHKELETHHINFQRDCLSDGKIKSKPYLHKNELSNLVILCSKCHDKIDTGEIIIKGYVDTSYGPMLDYKVDKCKRMNNAIDFLNKLNDKTKNISKKIFYDEE